MNKLNLKKFIIKTNKFNIGYLFFLYIYLEIISLVFLFILGLKKPNIIFINSKPIKPNNNELISNIDELGWGSNDEKKSTLKTEKCRIFLFGDSYIRMDTYKKINNLSHENYLSKLTNCEIINKGVNGYGVDQSYLNFQKSIKNYKIAQNDIIILGFPSENILRNLNRNRGFLYPKEKVTRLLLKPRFILNKGKLKLISIPKNLELKNYLSTTDIKYYPKDLIENEYFFPLKKSLNTSIKIEYSFLSKTLSIPFQMFVFPKLTRKANHSKFYKANHESNSLEILEKILIKFHEDCKVLKCKSISLDLPTASDFKEYNNYKTFPTELLNKRLKENQYNHISLTKLFYKRNKYALSKNHCLLHDGTSDGGDACNAHLNKKGHKEFLNILAENVQILKN